jgi:hypothetical protein
MDRVRPGRFRLPGLESGRPAYYHFGVDFVGFLILPCSALVAFVTLVGAAILGRNRPRLIWPFAFSSLIAVLAAFPLPPAKEFGMWLFTTSMVVLWSAAIGTVIGGLFARAVIRLRSPDQVTLMSAMGR